MHYCLLLVLGGEPDAFVFFFPLSGAGVEGDRVVMIRG